ncbi:MAG: hypothetical protein P4L96_05675 [Rhodoferax sp.]|nr:hypothetical protein [Rhodoferax sp.]
MRALVLCALASLCFCGALGSGGGGVVLPFQSKWQRVPNADKAFATGVAPMTVAAAPAVIDVSDAPVAQEYETKRLRSQASALQSHFTVPAMLADKPVCTLTLRAPEAITISINGVIVLQDSLAASDRTGDALITAVDCAMLVPGDNVVMVETRGPFDPSVFQIEVVAPWEEEDEEAARARALSAPSSTMSSSSSESTSTPALREFPSVLLSSLHLCVAILLCD